ncbi:hypothetical protein JX265_013570 [Neoarthrinium moseri]|uniref:Uncharacterized protein n=1 Tax=Neoarthrinium moseri TaxID=1658444 RepID=A0A9P9W874_9PEZI|nr:uncharacterized protein JN550_002915 [Neoarthrinium moseri]KAI1842075.1 hypothetical protein JX266_011726 [Neoarthrinium moseri]KAI1849564.1 hypothetical protein JX265_013570 [Neoarthrinium moseri]KAI1874336.1 hypothetical protein JN550_002915 [Neoarthrinium moseri]
MDTTMTSRGLDYYPESPTAHAGDFAMQKYLLLQSQHEELRQHMHELCPTYSCSSSTTVTSPSLSPTRSFTMSPSSSSHTSPSRNHRRSSASQRGGPRTSPSSLEPVLDEELVGVMAADELKLCDVNEGIKRALTELLNSDAVRRDRTMRTWVQTRLMDTERELRTGRRRRSNGSAD